MKFINDQIRILEICEPVAFVVVFSIRNSIHRYSLDPIRVHEGGLCAGGAGGDALRTALCAGGRGG